VEGQTLPNVEVIKFWNLSGSESTITCKCHTEIFGISVVSGSVHSLRGLV